MNPSYEAPEHVKHWSGYDPSDPPDEGIPDNMTECDCGHLSHFNETTTLLDDTVLCPNCATARNTTRSISSSHPETPQPE